MAKQCIGLDIGSSSVKAVQLRKKGTGWALQAFGMQPLVPQTIVDGTIMDQGAVADASSTDPNVTGTRQLFARLRGEPRVTATALQTVGLKGWDGLVIALEEVEGSVSALWQAVSVMAANTGTSRVVYFMMNPFQ